jgi:hypothetical protein
VYYVDIGLLIGGITGARRCLKTATIQHSNFAAAILDQPEALQCDGGCGDTHATHPQHVCQELMRDIKVVSVGAILSQDGGQTDLRWSARL